MDRGQHGTAQPITERINVSALRYKIGNTYISLQPHSRPIVSYYFPKGIGPQHYGVRLNFNENQGGYTLICPGKAPYETSPINFNKCLGHGLWPG